MPSEYQKWIARNEKPREEPVLTPAEKRKNWFDYHKWQLAAIAAAVLCLISIVSSNARQKRTGPDLQIAYIGSLPLPGDTAAALEEKLRAFGQDITGDGEVKVFLRQYVLSADPMTATQMDLDLAVGESRFFLLEDPQSFQTAYEALGYADGVFAVDAPRQEPLWHLWTECPALTGLDLDEGSQKLLSGLYIARRGQEQGYAHGDMDRAVWARMTAGE